MAWIGCEFVASGFFVDRCYSKEVGDQSLCVSTPLAVLAIGP